MTYVRDIDSSRAFYELLGFREQGRGVGVPGSCREILSAVPASVASQEPGIGVFMSRRR